jgi:GNAT superfamily N-acetyltransferase
LIVPTIERLYPPLHPDDLNSLARILVEAVESGGAVSFVQPLTLETARQWWTRTLDAFPPRGVLLGARALGQLVGTVQLQPAWAPNQPHRADVAKLLVRRDYQRRGVGANLMTALEAAARSDGFTLLTLDAKAGAPAADLYVRLGWTAVGTIPGFAHDPDGPLHDAVVMYKALGG